MFSSDWISTVQKHFFQMLIDKNKIYVNIGINFKSVVFVTDMNVIIDDVVKTFQRFFPWSTIFFWHLIKSVNLSWSSLQFWKVFFFVPNISSDFLFQFLINTLFTFSTVFFCFQQVDWSFFVVFIANNLSNIQFFANCWPILSFILLYVQK